LSYVKKCPHCGEAVLEKEVTEILCGGSHTAFINVKAGVCRHCGERLYTPEIIRQFEKIEAKLDRQDVSEFQAVGKSFQVVSSALTSL